VIVASPPLRHPPVEPGEVRGDGPGGADVCEGGGRHNWARFDRSPTGTGRGPLSYRLRNDLAMLCYLVEARLRGLTFVVRYVTPHICQLA
jgi:hypothetical protein